MTSDLRPYPEMKDSGVGALGRVPAHWRVRKLRQIGRFSKGNGGSKVDELRTGIPCIRYGDLYTSHTYFIHQSRGCISSERVEDYTPISYGDVLFAASGETIEEIGKSAVNLIKDEAYCGGDIILFRPSIEAHPKFMGYATDFRPATDQKARMGRGFTVVHVYSDQLKRLAVPLPPLREQASIVRFLDEADRRIRRYIRAKEKLIALLEGQKQAVNHQAVTGQIDVCTGQPYPAYKPSGVEWLGAVPVHWERRRLKSLLRPIDSRSITGEETLLSLRRDHGVVIYAEHFARPPQGSTHIGFKLVAVGHLVVNRLQANNGLVFRAGMSGLVSPEYSVFEPAQTFSMQYLSDLLRTVGYRAHFRRHAKGLGTGTSGFLRLYDDEFLATTVFLPPEQEQGRILRSLEKNRVETLKRIKKQERQLRFISEYRTRLIADVVTGKLDVRAAAATLPEEPHDPDAVEADCAGPEGRDDDRSDCDRRTAVPATQGEMTP